MDEEFVDRTRDHDLEVWSTTNNHLDHARTTKVGMTFIPTHGSCIVVELPYLEDRYCHRHNIFKYGIFDCNLDGLNWALTVAIDWHSFYYKYQRRSSTRITPSLQYYVLHLSLIHLHGIRDDC